VSEAPITAHARDHGTPVHGNAEPSTNGTDPTASDKLARLSGLLGGRVEIRRVALYREGRKSRYVFTVRESPTGEPVETKALDSEELLTLTNLQAAVHAVTGKLTDAPRRLTEPWRNVQDAISAAAEIVDEADEERAEWRWRIEHYVGDRLGMERDEAAREGEPFAEDGRVYVSSPRLRAYIDKVLSEKIDKGETHAGLRDQGYEPKRVGHENASYWRSPPGWQR
jgi:hypothetical protein